MFINSLFILAAAALALAEPKFDYEKFVGGDSKNDLTWPSQYPSNWPSSWGAKPTGFPKSWPRDKAWPSTWEKQWGPKPTAFPDSFPNGYGKWMQRRATDAKDYLKGEFGKGEEAQEHGEHGKGSGRWARSFGSGNGAEREKEHGGFGGEQGKGSGHWARNAEPYEHGEEGESGRHSYAGPPGSKKGSGVHWPRAAQPEAKPKPVNNPFGHSGGQFNAEKGHGPVVHYPREFKAEHGAGEPGFKHGGEGHWRREAGEENMGNGEYRSQKGKPMEFGRKGWF
ncbi:hypothetical protein NA57DRAFT_76587 [Rhizodiscina lignyota]|uniref:Uncharacterized protein n=1 Tax=Rhizodiscina lignyota TaxID=1504668 RepID=A0A9P4M9G9_9PEZI|nr:hypothetical protein NA57DRAFT_76587 [Rhizodiscina lignyota]